MDLLYNPKVVKSRLADHVIEGISKRWIRFRYYQLIRIKVPPILYMVYKIRL